MRIIRVFATVIIMMFSAVSAYAGGDTALTYQGRLLDAGNPANGLFDFEFSLWNAAGGGGGTQIGATQILNDVPVTDGLFTVQIDFGADAFNNNDRWLEIVVDATTLSPRQPITRAPYSIQTRGIFVGDNGNVGIGTTAPIAPLDVHNSSSGQILRLASDQTYGYIRFLEGSTSRAILGFGDDGGLLVNALPDSFAIDGMSTALHFAVDSDANKGITIDTNGNVGIGTTSPGSLLHVTGDTEFRSIAGYHTATAGSGNGVYGESLSNTGSGVFGYSGNPNGGTGVRAEADGDGGVGLEGISGSPNWGTGVFGRCVSPDGTGVKGMATQDSGTGIGVHGRGESTKGYDFYASGPGQNYGASSSIRWKSNVRNIDQPLEKIARLRGVYFDWDKDHGGHHDVGMIAEEVGEVLPEIVQYEENGIDASGMDYSKLTPLLVEAVNALQVEKDTEIASLENEVVQLRDRNADLELRLAQLETLVAQLAAQQGTEQ